MNYEIKFQLISQLYQSFLRISGNMLHTKTRPDAKFSIVPEEGWFGQPKYSTRSKNILRRIGFCLYILREVVHN